MDLLELHEDIKALHRQLGSVLNRQLALTLGMPNSSISPENLEESILSGDTTSTKLRRTFERLRLNTLRTSPYPQARLYATQQLPAPPQTSGMVSSRLPKPKRDYTQMICNVCGKKGHRQYYRGCTLHPNYRPHPFVPKPNDGAASFTQTIVSYTD